MDLLLNPCWFDFIVFIEITGTIAIYMLNFYCKQSEFFISNMSDF